MSNLLQASIYLIITTHLTMVAGTLYLHRSLTHRAVTFHPALASFFRFWLWLTDGVDCQDWVAQHRKHHIHSDKPEDPHSPVQQGIFNISVVGFFYTCFFRYGSRPFNTPEDKALFSKGVEPWDLETRFLRCGLLFLLGIDVALFGATGVLVWLVQVAWTPFWSNSVVTGLCHWKGGYKNPKAKDNSRNFRGLSLFLIGDNLHSNHHADPSNPNLSTHPTEFDLGYQYIKILTRLKLATHKKTPTY